MRVPAVVGRTWQSFSYVGLAVGTLFFAASLTPSLLPRQFAVQGVLSGLALAVGYGMGVLGVWLWLYLGIPEPSDRVQQVSKGITSAAVAIVAAWFLWQTTVWQNSIRELMEMEPVASAYPARVAAIAVVTGLALVALTRGLAWCWRRVHQQMTRFVPRRVSYVVSTILVVTAIVLLVNDVLIRVALDVADAAFLQLDQAFDDGIEQPTDSAATGSAASLVEWDSIGRMGTRFIAGGPTQEQISQFRGQAARQPLRVYVGLASRETVEERAQLALEELVRVGGFERKVLVVATPTGTGWLDPGAVDTLEYLHGGDTAIVSMQYSYLPSWITILVEPDRSRASATALFELVYHHWKSLPHASRPKLYVHGLSLGALGSAASADLFTIFEDPIQGGLWSGPPFASGVWTRSVRQRNADSPMWLPTFRDGSLLRFAGKQSPADHPGQRWGPMRFVYIQHASDPMTFFSPDLLYREPAWLVGRRGPDISPHLTWLPIVTFLQVGFDIPMATTVPTGYGHNFAAADYIDGWVAVTDPAGWSNEDSVRLKQAIVGKR